MYAHACEHVFLGPLHLHVSAVWVDAHILFGVLEFHWQA